MATFRSKPVSRRKELSKPHLRAENRTVVANPDVTFVVGDRASRRLGYSWKVWADRTSFYLVARYAPVSGVKVSLHGPDPDRTNPGNKVAPDRVASVGAREAGGIAVWAGDPVKRFDGQPVAANAKLVARYRATPGLFRQGTPNGPELKDLKKGRTGLLIPAPAPGAVSDLDFFVSTGSPYWPNHGKALLDHAALGPLRNGAGQFLTAVSFRRTAAELATPDGAIGVPPHSRSDRTRAIGVAADDLGVMWILEQWMSKAVLAAMDTQMTGAVDAQISVD